VSRVVRTKWNSELTSESAIPRAGFSQFNTGSTSPVVYSGWAIFVQAVAVLSRVQRVFLLQCAESFSSRVVSSMVAWCRVIGP